MEKEKKNRDLSKLLVTAMQKTERKGDRKNERSRPKLDKDQCAYCKGKGRQSLDPRGGLFMSSP